MEGDIHVLVAGSVPVRGETNLGAGQVGIGDVDNLANHEGLARSRFGLSRIPTAKDFQISHYPLCPWCCHLHGDKDGLGQLLRKVHKPPAIGPVLVPGAHEEIREAAPQFLLLFPLLLLRYWHWHWAEPGAASAIPYWKPRFSSRPVSGDTQRCHVDPVCPPAQDCPLLRVSLSPLAPLSQCLPRPAINPVPVSTLLGVIPCSVSLFVLGCNARWKQMYSISIC